MTARARSRAPKKIFHKIGEVCELTKTEPYVLRYWESEFPFLAPEKNRAGQRIYTDEDIDTVLAIKRLLYEEGYTTAGARRRLEKEREDRAGGPLTAAEIQPVEAEHPVASVPMSPVMRPAVASAPSRETTDLKAVLSGVRDELRSIRELLRKGAPAESTPQAPDSATVRPRRARR
jgi:DNA-binding transcriptional MerR regulator